MFFGFLVFALTLGVFFTSEINLSDQDEQQFADIRFTSRLVTDCLVGSGYPAGWNATSVTEIGVTDSYRVNATKLLSMTTVDYTRTKTLLRTRYDYYLYFTGDSGVLPVAPGREGVGKPGVNSTNIVQVEDPKNLIQTSRMVIYGDKPARMVVYLWD
jgi:hypothetical protein